MKNYRFTLSDFHTPKPRPTKQPTKGGKAAYLRAVRLVEESAGEVEGDVDTATF